MATVAPLPAPRPSPKGKQAGVSPAKGRLRKLPKSVNTSLISYDRADPFFALNALRKLLSILPSRIGGCQYKFTPEEHKLSLHLLTIVEPFVGLSHSRRTLTRQPTEILDSIVFHIDSQHDLLSLALSCHRMHAIIFPRHYHYRLVRCKVSSLHVWNHLVVHKSLARNVRRLEILDERSAETEVIPAGIMTTDTDLESTDDELTMHAKQERYLVSALAKMTALQSFSWCCNHSPISIDNIWPTLLKCQSIQGIDINDNLVFSSYVPQVEGDSSTQRRSRVFPELRTVSLRSTRHLYGSTKSPHLSRISGMLSNCPNLENLDIGYEQRRGQGFQVPSSDDLFLFSRWPNLRSLALTNLRYPSTRGLDAAASFFGAHFNLEILHLDLAEGASTAHRGLQFVLPHNSLPKLRDLRCSKEFATAVLSCTSDVVRPLEVIKGIKLSGPIWDGSFFLSLSACASTLKRLELSGWNEMEDIKHLVECAPRLTWLDIGRKSGSQAHQLQAHRDHSAKATPVINTNVSEWANLLAPLTELTTFHGVRFFYEVSSLTLSTLASASPTSLSTSELSRVRKNEKVAGVLANKCVKLRRVDHWDEISGAGAKVIVLLREGNEVKWDVRRVKG